MTTLKCSECGGTVFAKEGGLYVCQYCGGKIKPEQASIVHNTYNLEKGTIVMDDGYDFQKTAQLMVDAIEGTRYKEASKYARTIYEHNPHDDGAYFIMITTELIFKPIDKLSFQDSNSISLACSRAKKQMKEGVGPDEPVIKLTPEYVSMLLYVVLGTISGDAVNKFKEKHTARQAKDLADSLGFLLDFLNEIEKNEDLLTESSCKKMLYDILFVTTMMIKKGVNWEKSTKSGTTFNKERCSEDVIDKARKTYERIIPRYKEYNPTEKIAPFDKKGCYIATSIYGSYDCPQVWTLRRYRDIVLTSTLHGKLIIKLYYAISPTVVKLFGDTKIFKRLFKPWLDKKVCKLNNKGFSDQPYDDTDP